MRGYLKMQKNKLSFILGSASPRRKELIGHLGIPFEIIKADIDEISAEKDPKKFVLDISRQKNQAILNNLSTRDDFLLLTADTSVCLENHIFGKPADLTEAREILLSLRGKTHLVHTAVVMTLKSHGFHAQHSFVDESKVRFSNFSEHILKRYLDTQDSLDKAGAYGIQGPSLTFVEHLDGSYANVVGFPLSRFVEELDKFLTSKGFTSWEDAF